MIGNSKCNRKCFHKSTTQYSEKESVDLNNVEEHKSLVDNILKDLKLNKDQIYSPSFTTVISHSIIHSLCRISKITGELLY